ncbi:MAG: site-2 protease family protein [Planctomycetota bacterium]
MSDTTIVYIIAYVLIIYSIILHEIAHAASALWQGDDTALLAGRITLNPIPHIDLFGTVIIPVIIALTGVRFLFGWAKPVPVNPLKFRRPVLGDIIVSISGVTVNFLLAILFAALLHLAKQGSVLQLALFIASATNVLLAIFNLIPIPPLDGSHVFKYILKPEDRAGYESIGFYGMFLIMIVLTVFGQHLSKVTLFIMQNVIFKITFIELRI